MQQNLIRLFTSYYPAASGTLPGDILDESGYGLSYNNGMDQSDTFDDYYSMDCRKKEFTFQGSYRPKSRFFDLEIHLYLTEVYGTI